MRFKNITLLLGALLMLSATSQAANVALGKKGHSCISPWQYNHVIQRS